MIVPLTRLLEVAAKLAKESGKLAAALTNLVNAVVTGALGVYLNLKDADLDALRKWWQGVPQEQTQPQQALPSLSKEADALYHQIQQILETQYQIDALKRLVLTLPALPDEGY